MDLLGVRWYDPLIGRFITSDPDFDGLNWYAYAGNNPVTSIDPTGMDWLNVVANFSAGMGDTISCGITNQVRRSITGPGWDGVQYGSASHTVGRVTGYVWHVADLGSGALEGVFVRNVAGKAASKEAANIAQKATADATQEADAVAQNSIRRSINSLQKQLSAHEAKLDAYRANPDVYDNQGLLRNAGEDMVRRQRIINGRIAHLSQEIQTFRQQIAEKQALLRK